MWILPKGNQLFGSSCLQGESPAQQGESESCGWIHFTPKFHRNLGFFGLVGHFGWLIKRFVKIAQSLHDPLSREGPSKKSEQVTLTEEAHGAFVILKKPCLKAPVLAFADFDKPFLLETDASKLGLGAVLSQKQTDGCYCPVAYASWSVTTHESNYHCTKLGFLALKWVIREQFEVYLLWKPFIVKAVHQDWQQYAHIHHDDT